MTKSFDWNARVDYNAAAKRSFHATARKRLAALASELGLAPGTFDIRSNMGGIAVSGEVTLHSESVYIQASQGCGMTCLMIRSCKGRRDYTGGPNRFLPLSMLNDVPLLARCIVNGRMAVTPYALMSTARDKAAFARALSAAL